MKRKNVQSDLSSHAAVLECLGRCLPVDKAAVLSVLKYMDTHVSESALRTRRHVCLSA